MSTQRWINHLRVAAAAALCTVAGVALAGELKLAHFMSPQHPLHGGIMAPLAKQVEQATGGALKVRIYPAGELGRARASSTSGFSIMSPTSPSASRATPQRSFRAP